jgi:GNAT superfamily N-acetyltransferase
MQQNNIDRDAPAVLHVEPVLAVTDIIATLNYWRDVLGFENTWSFGNPPNHGGVSWKGSAFIQFGLNPELALTGRGHSLWIRARNLGKLYKIHQDNGAAIVSMLEDKPWGFAEYTVEDINGYFIHFASPAGDKPINAKPTPENVRLVLRKPTAVEYNKVMASIGWATLEENVAEPLGIGGVVALGADGNAVGCVLLLGDDAGFYYIKDLAVDPAWQRLRVGTEMMHMLLDWLQVNAPNNATVGLFCGDHLATFYKQFGFTPVTGMYQQIIRK